MIMTEAHATKLQAPPLDAPNPDQLDAPPAAADPGCKIDRLKNSMLHLLTELEVEIETRNGSAELDLRRGIDLQREIERYEISLIRRALKLTGGNQAKAALLLGVKHTTLNSKVKRYGLQ
jgi:transcriptional regulator with GAF, ATPase, and Fis domain